MLAQYSSKIKGNDVGYCPFRAETSEKLNNTRWARHYGQRTCSPMRFDRETRPRRLLNGRLGGGNYSKSVCYDFFSLFSLLMSI